MTIVRRASGLLTTSRRAAALCAVLYGASCGDAESRRIEELQGELALAGYRGFVQSEGTEGRKALLAVLRGSANPEHAVVFDAPWLGGSERELELAAMLRRLGAETPRGRGLWRSLAILSGGAYEGEVAARVTLRFKEDGEGVYASSPVLGPLLDRVLAEATVWIVRAEPDSMIGAATLSAAVAGGRSSEVEAVVEAVRRLADDALLPLDFTRMAQALDDHLDGALEAATARGMALELEQPRRSVLLMRVAAEGIEEERARIAEHFWPDQLPAFEAALSDANGFLIQASKALSGQDRGAIGTGTDGTRALGALLDAISGGNPRIAEDETIRFAERVDEATDFLKRALLMIRGVSPR